MLCGVQRRVAGQLVAHARAGTTQLPAASAAVRRGQLSRCSNVYWPAASPACCRQFSCSCAARRRQMRPRPPPAPEPAPAGPQQWDAAALAASLYSLLSAEERVLAVSQQSAAAALELLRQLQFTERQLSELLLNAPALLRRGPASWRAVVPTLLEHGCATHQLLEMLAACPALLDCGRGQLEATLSALQAGLPTADAALLELLQRQPGLLLLPAGRLQRQLAHLLTVFTAEQTARVALRCPAVLLERWAETSHKIDYLTDTMGLTPTDVAHSSAMAFPLAHVRTRHTALERSGGYIRPRPKDTEPTGNPTPTEIVDHSDQLFCQRVARLPYREYEVFSWLLQAEMEDEAAVSEGEESDSDTDEDEPTTGYHSKGRGGR